MICIDQTLELSTEEGLENLNQMWKGGQIVTLLAAKAAKVKLQNPIATVSGVVKVTKKIMIQLFETVHINGLCTVLFMANSYLHIKQSTNQVPLGLHNLSCRVVAIPAKTVVAKISAANEVLPRPAPKLKEGVDTEIEQNPMEPRKLKQLFEKIDLSGTPDWSSEEQQEVKDLITEYCSLFNSPWASTIMLVRKKAWWFMLLYQFAQVEFMHCERCL